MQLATSFVEFNQFGINFILRKFEISIIKILYQVTRRCQLLKQTANLDVETPLALQKN